MREISGLLKIIFKEAVCRSLFHPVQGEMSSDDTDKLHDLLHFPILREKAQWGHRLKKTKIAIVRLMHIKNCIIFSVVS